MQYALLPARRRDPPLIFMQDNATCHTANPVLKWLRENVRNYLTWPAQSPDLSPLENIWSQIKNELWKQRARIRTPYDTWVLSRQIAQRFTLVYINNLYNTMPERMEAVIESKGNRIGY